MDERFRPPTRICIHARVAKGSRRIVITGTEIKPSRVHAVRESMCRDNNDNGIIKGGCKAVNTLSFVNTNLTELYV